MVRAGSVSSISSGSYSETGSSYGYSSASSLSAASSVEVVRVRPRAFHVPSLARAAPLATPLERIVLERPERPELSVFELSLGSASIGSSVLLFCPTPEWGRLASCSRELQLCLLHHLHLQT